MRAKKNKVKPAILVDTSEKAHKKWMWQESNEFAASQMYNIQNGDYAIEGLVDNGWLYLERKNSWYELYTNFVTKDWDRFKACLERIKDYKYKFIVIEASVNDMYYQRPPKARVRPDAVLKKILEACMDYGVTPIWAGTAAKTMALSILKRAYERWLKENKS